MAPNRERPRRGEVHRAKKTDMELHLETRRAEMYAAEGHAGSIPRGNQEPEQRAARAAPPRVGTGARPLS